MCQDERLRYSCCTRTERPEAAMLRLCILSNPVDKDDWRTGKRQPCEYYQRNRHTEVIQAKFCCSENCCQRLLQPYRRGVGLAVRAVSEQSGWKRGLPSIAAEQLEVERKELERAEGKHVLCKVRRAEFYAPHVFDEQDLEVRRRYEESLSHARWPMLWEWVIF